jgi:hypothetical protein
MGATGTATVNFGGFPGSSDTTVLVTGQTGIVAGSLVEAWLIPVDTGDHSADEHIADGPRIMAGNIVPGTGFTIYGMAWPSTIDPVPEGTRSYLAFGQNVMAPDEPYGRKTPMPYGQWSVAWVWN